MRLHFLMEEQQKLEIGQRITELRERGPFTQPTIADKLGIRLRSYQKVEAKGTSSFDRCEELYEIHREWTERSEDYQHVSAQWIWDGKERDGTPDVLSQLNGSTETDGVAELQRQIAALRLELLAEIGEVRKAQADLLRQTTPASRRSAKTRK